MQVAPTKLVLKGRTPGRVRNAPLRAGVTARAGLPVGGMVVVRARRDGPRPPAAPARATTDAQAPSLWAMLLALISTLIY